MVYRRLMTVIMALLSVNVVTGRVSALKSEDDNNKTIRFNHEVASNPTETFLN